MRHRGSDSHMTRRNVIPDLAPMWQTLICYTTLMPVSIMCYFLSTGTITHIQMWSNFFQLRLQSWKTSSYYFSNSSHWETTISNHLLLLHFAAQGLQSSSSPRRHFQLTIKLFTSLLPVTQNQQTLIFHLFSSRPQVNRSFHHIKPTRQKWSTSPVCARN